MKPTPAACLLFCLFSVPAAANDTTAQLSTGGLVFVPNASVEMRSEDLFVSPERIKVTYRFHNKADADQHVLVAFPLPDITGEPDMMLSIPDGPADNIFGFSTSFNGKPVAAALHQYAFSNNIDYSSELKSLNIPLNPFGEETHAALLALPDAQKQRLTDLGLVIRDENSDVNGSDFDMLPIWTLRSAYSWEATFPAGRDAEVIHTYQPSVGATVATTFVPTGGDEGIDKGAEETLASYKQKYCVDEALMATLKKSVVSPEGYAYVPYAESWISYIWSTGANWAGPVGRFTLTVDKGDPTSLVSFCGEGVKKIGPTQFQMTATDWLPDGEHELEILLLNRLDVPQ